MEISSEPLPNSEILEFAQPIDRQLPDQVSAAPCSAEQRPPHCLWCGRAFTTRATGGSAQRFCSTEHRKAFWTAARRWTMRAIETGLSFGRLPEGYSGERTRCENALWIGRGTSPREMSRLMIGRTRMQLRSRSARPVTSLAGLVPATL